MNLLSTLTQAIPAILTGFQGKSNKKQKGVADEIGALSRASYDMDSPQFQNLYRQNQGAMQQDLSSTIAEISRQNRKLTTMGRRPLLDQERGGESIFRNLMTAQSGIGDRARGATFDQLNRGISGLSTAYGAYDKSADADWENKLRKVGSFYSMGDAMRGLGIGGQAEDYNDIVTARNSANQSQNMQMLLKQLMGL
jgi:hypothetical protein